MPKVQVTRDWDAVKTDIAAFAKVFLRKRDGSVWEPHPAQLEILRGVKRTTTVVTGRQFGKSEGFAAKAVFFGVTHPHRKVWVFAPTLEQAKIIFGEIVQFFNHKPLSDLIEGKVHNSPFPYFKLKNGVEYHCRGLNSPHNGRGNNAHLAIVDEASFVKEGVIREVVEPFFNVTGKEKDSALVLVSTPYGQGEFYDAWTSCGKQVEAGNPRFARFQFTSFDNPYADMEHLEEIKSRYGEDSPIWLAEYMGQFQDDDLQVFSSRDIKTAYEMWDEDWRFPLVPLPNHRYVQGVDLANRSDYFVATVLDVTSRERNVLSFMDRYRRRGYPFYKSRVRANFNAFNRARTIGDATSMGESVVQDLADISILGYEISTNDAKWQIVQELNRMFQERRLVIPFQKDIIAELGYFRYNITPAKVMRMEAPRGKHDDIVMSLALCAHLASVPVMVGKVRSLSVGSFGYGRKSEKVDHNKMWREYMGEDAA
jgi:hypothetical protein